MLKKLASILNIIIAGGTIFGGAWFFVSGQKDAIISDLTAEIDTLLVHRLKPIKTDIIRLEAMSQLPDTAQILILYRLNRVEGAISDLGAQTAYVYSLLDEKAARLNMQFEPEIWLYDPVKQKLIRKVK